MLKLVETQNGPASSRRTWVTPELRSLDLKATLCGAQIVYDEGRWTSTDGTVSFPTGTAECSVS